MDLSSDEEEALLLFSLQAEEENLRRKKQWVHPINLGRERFGEFHTLMSELRKDEKRFYIYYRMSIECFDELLSLIANDIRKMDTNFREAIAPEIRLAITLRYLATGDSFSTIGHSFRVGFSTVSEIVQEVCEAICNRLGSTYLPEPTTETWTHAAEGFKNRWRFPNCIGSIDGKHVTIKCPDNSGSNYWCYQHKFSMVLMAIVGPDYKFLCVDIGGYGKNSDGGIFEMSAMGQRFEQNLMNVPEPSNLPGQNEPCPYVLVGDEAFALKPYLMRPFPYRQSRGNIQLENFNTSLSGARMVVENAFGILAQKWRIFLRPIETQVSTTIITIKAACILHNFLRTKNSHEEFSQYLEPPSPELGAFVSFDHDARRATRVAFATRDKFVKYFNK